MNELQQVLSGDSAHALPASIVEGLPDDGAHRKVSAAPHTIYEELWHIVFWQQMTLDWIAGIETPYPANMADPFPNPAAIERESWDELRERFFRGMRVAAAVAGDEIRLDVLVTCPSRPGQPARIMTVREQLESLGAHNAYHFGRIVLLRQLLGCWPPPSGGYNW